MSRIRHEWGPGWVRAYDPDAPRTGWSVWRRARFGAVVLYRAYRAGLPLGEALWVARQAVRGL